VILREGDAGDTCYVMRSGRARIMREHSDGRAITLTNVGPGEIFGELAMFGGEVRSATVETIEEVEAVAILADDLKRLLSDHPEITVKLLEALAKKLRQANERIAGQSFQ
jgi:CRP/FNR family transcriptional regulator